MGLNFRQLAWHLIQFSKNVFTYPLSCVRSLHTQRSECEAVFHRLPYGSRPIMGVTPLSSPSTLTVASPLYARLPGKVSYLAVHAGITYPDA